MSVAVVLGLVATAWLAWRRAAVAPIRSGACAGCNVLLITIDTLRSDRVGAFGGPSNLTPTLDRLAGEGLRLTHAYSSAPLTLPSHTSIMTAVSPPVHGVRANGLSRLGPELPTLAGILAAHGYRTGAFVGAFVVDARFGLNRGFGVYDDRYGEKHAGDETEGAERRAEEVIKPAAAWILGRGASSPNTDSARPEPVEGRAGRWFAWVHLYDPHEPYRAPEPYASQHAPYDAEVAYTDAMIGRLVDELSQTGELDRTLVAVVADHGESLGEHGERTHGVFAYDVTLRVPWFLWAGSRITPQAFDGIVRLIDLAPTILDLVGVPAPQSFEGQSIVARIGSRDRTFPPVYFEAMDANLTRNWAPLTGIIAENYKFIDLPLPELYDLASDPRETTNVLGREPERARTLERLLKSETARLAARASSPEQVTLNAESRQRLQALGYVATSADPNHRVYTDADDPKNLVDAANQLNDALADFKRGADDRATAAVDAILRAHPGFTTAYGVLASMQHDRGELRGAIATLEETVRRGIANPSVMVVLAGYLQEAGALDRAAGVLEAVIASHPDYADAYNSLGVVYSRLGRHDRARAAFNKVLELDPTSATAYENLAVDSIATGDLSGAASELKRALELDPRLAGAHNALAAVYLRQNRQQDAIAEWRLALDADPRLFDALYNLGTVLWDLGRRDDARRYLERFANEAPPARYASDIARVRRMLAS